jgi:hypothetical protein
VKRPSRGSSARVTYPSDRDFLASVRRSSSNSAGAPQFVIKDWGSRAVNASNEIGPPLHVRGIMSISPVSGSTSAASNAAPQTNTKLASPSAAAGQPANSQAAAAVVKSTVSAVVNEATETSAQTIREAASGDRQALKRLHIGAVAHGSTTGSIINTKA